MTPAEATIVAGVNEKLGELIDGLDRLGADYARALIDAVTTGSPRTPMKPRDLHPDLARAVRDITLEEIELELGSLPVKYR